MKFESDKRYGRLQRRCQRWGKIARFGDAGLRRALTALADYHFRHGSDWTTMIKALGPVGRLPLNEIFAVALGHEGWNRWCRRQVTRNRNCAKQYLDYRRDCQLRGEQPLLMLADEQDEQLREQFGLRHKRYKFRPQRLYGSGWRRKAMFKAHVLTETDGKVTGIRIIADGDCGGGFSANELLLASGKKVTGCIGFEIPKKATPESITIVLTSADGTQQATWKLPKAQ